MGDRDGCVQYAGLLPGIVSLKCPCLDALGLPQRTSWPGRLGPGCTKAKSRFVDLPDPDPFGHAAVCGGHARQTGTRMGGYETKCGQSWLIRH